MNNENKWAFVLFSAYLLYIPFITDLERTKNEFSKANQRRSSFVNNTLYKTVTVELAQRVYKYR